MRKIILCGLLLLLFAVSFGQINDSSLCTGTKPFILGVIDTLYSNVLSETRILNIYLPEGYNAKESKKYSVVYLLDGSANEDFIHVVGLYQFNNFDWIKRVPKSIIVGIATVDRKRDFTFPSAIQKEKSYYPTSGHSDKFINFIQNELQPYIERKYKTNVERTIIGQSLGGLLATEILFEKPALFNKYIIISPSLWWSNGTLFNADVNILKRSVNKETGIYIGVGKEGLTPGDSPHVMEVDANLLAEKINSLNNKYLKVYFDYLPQENHATISHQAIFNALRLLYPLN